ncbi:MULTISPECIES: phage integrase SAM-like domain-containing protein [unclassified Flavobacterium]|uniref:phage integrase SAM-like domain-containing protein n=1 Tax=unclassified Flavobacterium TaxID=196869 RepID=UPI003F8E7772
MATLKFLLRSTIPNSNIFVRYSISREIRLMRKTGLIIDSKFWDKEKGQPKQTDQVPKEFKSKLDKLAIFINEAYNNGVSLGTEFTNDWLQLQIDLYNNKTPVVDLDILTNYIQKYIDEAPYKQNAKMELGLSAGRVQNLKLFKNTIKKYESEVFKGKTILIKDVNLLFLEKFKMWMFNKGYSANYVGKNIANFRTVCRDASKNDFVISSQVKNFKGLSETRQPEDIITLNEQEQEAIKKATLLRESLINARKWLLLGCSIGQRASDLLNITDKNIIEVNNGIKLIELKQQKTGKLVAIPLLPEALEIIESGMPYKISLTRFNEYIKDVCQIAKINKPTKARIKEKAGEPHKTDVFPKWKVISSHVCRRSFATNFYGRIPTPVLMSITAHGTERVFLNYIGKTTYDNAYQMLEYFSKLVPRQTTSPVMEVMRNTSNK